MKDETEFLLKRASQEAHLAINSEQAEAADVHEELSVLYSAKAVALLHEKDAATEPEPSSRP